ncbi:hypothetical protein EMCRGX_G026228 [Ephydatia muelleri]
MSEGTPDAVKPIASGYLFKLARNKRYFETWHRRYYVLYSDGSLHSFKNLRSSTLTRTISIGRKCIAVRFGEEVGNDDCNSWPSNIPKYLCFSIVNSDRSYHFICESRREFERWEASLREARHKIQSSGQSQQDGKPDHGTAGGGAGAVGGGASPKAVKRKSIEEDAETEGYDKTGSAHPYLVFPRTEELPGASSDENAHAPNRTGNRRPLSTEIHLAEPKSVEETLRDGEAQDEPVQNEVFLGTRELDTTRKRPTSVVQNDASGYDHVGPAASSTGQDSDSEEGDEQQGAASNAHTEINGADDKDTEGKYTDKKDPPADVHDVSFTASTALLHHVDEIVHEAFNEMVAEETATLPVLSPEPPTLASPGPALTAIQLRIRQFTEGSNSNVSDKSDTSATASLNARLQPQILDAKPMVSPPLSQGASKTSGMSVPPSSHSSSTSKSSHSQNEELRQLVNDIMTIGHKTDEGMVSVLFGDLLRQGTSQSISAGLRAAKKLKMVNYQGEILFQGTHNNTEIVLLKTEIPGTPSSAVASTITGNNISPATSSNTINASGPSPPPDIAPSLSWKHKRLSEPNLSSHLPLKRDKSFPMAMSELIEEEEAPSGDRVMAAVQWVDKELKKLVDEIMALGKPNSEGLFTVKFGVLFENTVDKFEALSGVLKTAKKHKLVSYPVELLFQGKHNDVDIVLLKSEIEESSLEKYTTTKPKGIKRTDLEGVERRRKTSGFGNATQIGTNSKCFICGKVIYPVEFVAANEYTFHKSCFRQVHFSETMVFTCISCCQCSKVLSPSAYATINDTFYCPTHYERMFMARGSYAALQLSTAVTV